ncbi:MAG: CAP domain-containing protein [Caldilineaceae bacterium]
MRAVNENGTSPYSNESYSSTFDGVPNHDEQYLHVLINEARAAPGAFGYPTITPVPPVAYSAQLSYATRAHSQSILNSGFQIGHCDIIGRCPGDRAAAVGYIGGGAENLVQGQTGPASVEGANQSFMDSDGHRDNRLCPCTQEIGLGHTYDPDKGGDSPWKGQYTEQFAERQEFVLPNLPSGIAIPYSGDQQTEFTFIVNYYHPDGAAPEEALVLIDGQPNAMALSTGAAANGTYRLRAKLAPGEHHYAFAFSFAGGSARLPATQGYLLAVSGPTSYTPGDGNGDGVVNGADVGACVQEIFDGDGNNRELAYYGRMAGTAGCDANGDTVIEAADLSCIVQLIANGAGSCSAVGAATVGAAAELTIGAAVSSQANVTMVPIQLTTGGQASSAIAFALYPGPGFVSEDRDGDGLPDGVQIAAGQSGLTATMAWQGDRLDLVLLDAELPIQTLSDGTLLTLTFQDADGSAVTFDRGVPASLGSPTGGSVPITQPAAGNLIFLPVVVR